MFASTLYKSIPQLLKSKKREGLEVSSEEPQPPPPPPTPTPPQPDPVPPTPPPRPIIIPVPYPRPPVPSPPPPAPTPTPTPTPMPTPTPTPTSNPPPVDGTVIDIYVYFDKVYVLITVAFFIIIFLVPTAFSWLVFLIYVAVMVLIYLYRNNLFDITTWFAGKSSTDDKKPITEKPEVFHVANQRFDYDSAQAVCKAYDSRLATYKEMEEAYNKGADWCTYGWSEGQNVFFPTQQSTFDSLQTNKGHEHDCGRPGVNGGYIADANFQFGANCYGKKPIMTDADKMLMDATAPYPKNAQDLKMEKEVSFWKTHLAELLVSPFNKNSWDEPYLRV